MGRSTKHCRYLTHACIRLKQPLLCNMAVASLYRRGSCCAHWRLQSVHLEARLVSTAQHGLCQRAQAQQLGRRHYLQLLLPVGSRGWPTVCAGALICRPVVYRQQVSICCACRECMEAQAWASFPQPPLFPPILAPQALPAGGGQVRAGHCLGEALHHYWSRGNSWPPRHDHCNTPAH